ncbi:MAG: hypothetical protein ACTSXQ_06025 [Alphaproteobacteria bacterium]
MATQIQRRGGSTSDHETFVGADREITIDTSKKTLVVHDGATEGGSPLAREDLSNVSKETILAKISSAEIFNFGCPVGVVFPYAGKATPTGFLILNGATIGAFGAGADFMGDPYKALYVFLWNSIVDLPIEGERGASAGEDWDAWKKITLPDGRGRSILGAGQGTDLTARNIGSTGGTEKHQLTVEEMPKHRHYMGTILSDAGSSNDGPNGASDGSYPDRWTEYEGADVPHNNMPPWLALTWIIKT